MRNSAINTVIARAGDNIILDKPLGIQRFCDRYLQDTVAMEKAFTERFMDELYKSGANYIPSFLPDSILGWGVEEQRRVLYMLHENAALFSDSFACDCTAKSVLPYEDLTEIIACAVLKIIPYNQYEAVDIIRMMMDTGAIKSAPERFKNQILLCMRSNKLKTKCKEQPLFPSERIYWTTLNGYNYLKYIQFLACHKHPFVSKALEWRIMRDLVESEFPDINYRGYEKLSKVLMPYGFSERDLIWLSSEPNLLGVSAIFGDRQAIQAQRLIGYFYEKSNSLRCGSLVELRGKLFSFFPNSLPQRLDDIIKRSAWCVEIGYKRCGNQSVSLENLNRKYCSARGEWSVNIVEMSAGEYKAIKLLLKTLPKPK